MKHSGQPIITVTTGSRLHFGLTRIRPSSSDHSSMVEPDACGGIGVMINNPQTVVQIAASDHFLASGSDRLSEFAKDWAANRQLDYHQLPCKISVTQSSLSHCGLGSGTQLAHATAYAMELFFNQPLPENVAESTTDLSRTASVASQLQRGARSMIGSYGFACGGLIVDGVPPAATDEVAKIVYSQSLPDDWRVVIVCHRNVVKKFGVAEKEAFRHLIHSESERPKQERLQHDLQKMIHSEIIPSAQSANFETFCNSIHQYGKLSGEFYTKVQGGIYNGPVITSVVNDVLQMGGRGVGQSSWGPVVFSWSPDEPTAMELRNRLASHYGERAEVWMSKVRNNPASISTAYDMHESSK